MTPDRPAWIMCAGLFLLCAGGCQPSDEALDGFVLPEGRADAGERAFTRLGCNDCHVIEGRDDLRMEDASEMRIPLGDADIRGAGDLATSIINPSHRVAGRFAQEGLGGETSSPMRNYKDLITVGELADLVAFLQSEYE